MGETQNPFQAPRTDSVPRPASHRLLRWTWVRPVVFGMALILAMVSAYPLIAFGWILWTPVGQQATQETHDRMAISAGVFAGSTFVAFATGVSMIVRRNARRKRLQHSQPTDADN